MQHPQPHLLILACGVALLAWSVTGLAESVPPTHTDARDGREYRLVTIGAATWFAEHLNYAAPGSYCYADEPANCEEYGRLYPWEVALSACPAGWHLATELDWQLLEFEFGMAVDALEETETRGVDEGAKMEVGGGSGLELKRAGYRNPDGTYAQLGEAAALWTATEADTKNAWHRDVRSGRRESWRSREYKPYAMSVRCVENQYAPQGTTKKGMSVS
jgi:uncharacterized protein (TIGR02145 family)